jgi:hypothetical protein
MLATVQIEAKTRVGSVSGGRCRERYQCAMPFAAAPDAAT